MIYKMYHLLYLLILFVYEFVSNKYIYLKYLMYTYINILIISLIIIIKKYLYILHYTRGF